MLEVKLWDFGDVKEGLKRDWLLEEISGMRYIKQGRIKEKGTGQIPQSLRFKHFLEFQTV